MDKKKFLAALVVAVLAIVGLGFAFNSSSATDDDDSENKKVTLCHATGSEKNPYEKITVSVNAFYNAGHITHTGDIWEAFTYTTNKGEVVNVPARGDTSLLAFEDCVKPKVDEKVAKPESVFADPCGTENDVFSVAPGRGYAVGNVVVGDDTQSITVTLAEGFAWLDGTKTPVTITKPAFTNVDCDLPDTGVGATYATASGFGALAGILALGVLMFARRRVTS